MLRFNLFNKGKPQYSEMIETLIKIRNGDKLQREKFIVENKIFILKTVGHVLDSYVNEENDEYSIGLLAFNEAIDKFDVSKNGDFYNFSHQVIKWRIIDYIRLNTKNSKTYPFSYFSSTDENEGIEDEKFLKIQGISFLDNDETSEEIFIFKQHLAEYGISLKDLVFDSPKHKDSIRLCINIARSIINQEILMKKLEKSKRLPISDLLKIVSVSKKTLERNRKFIIAVTLIIQSKLEILNGYVEYAEKGGGDLE
ncbi:MAG: RNA polymerase sigma-I factor [Clostridia bacterium]|nr:RNA polymerase sigma-I factor [Clostridia bacterium]